MDATTEVNTEVNRPTPRRRGRYQAFLATLLPEQLQALRDRAEASGVPITVQIRQAIDVALGRRTA